MVRTYWFFPGFNEASGNLDLQLNAHDQIESNFGPVLCAPMVAALARGGRGYCLRRPLRQKLVCAFAPGQLSPMWTWSLCAVVRSTPF